MRAIAIAAVLLFHGGFAWARGGFLGVSLFFTLSGFLVTSLLLAERRDTGRVRVGRFWERRARRLLPGALATIAVVVFLVPRVGDLGQRQDLRGDAVSAAGYVANWHFVAGEHSYGDLFQAPSPLLHYWSLAIEEQLYLLLPLIVVGALALGRGRLRVVGGSLVLLTAASIATSWLLADSVDRVYFGTDTRAAELLMGAVLAVLWADPVRARTIGRLTAWLAPAAIAALVVMVHFAQTDDRWLRTGGFAAIAALNAIVVAAAAGDSFVARALSVAPLRALGRVSYAVYLVHWPVFVFVDAHRTDADGLRLFALRLAVTLAITLAWYHLVECPIRFGRRLVRRRSLVGAAALATASIVVAATLTTVPAEPPSAVASPFIINTSTLEPTSRVRIAVVGDGAEMFSASLPGEAGLDVIRTIPTPGCPIVSAAAVRRGPRGEARSAARCSHWSDAWAPARRAAPDLLVIVQGRTDTFDHLDGTSWTSIERPERSQATKQAYERVVASMRDAGLLVAWVTPRRSGARSRAVADIIGTLSDRELGMVALPATADPATVLQAYRDAQGELRRAWPRPLGRDAPDPLRLLVVGDSTSLFVATGLEAAGRKRGDLVVAWAGSLACPFMHVDAFRDPKGFVFPTAKCPSYDSWPIAASSFEADAVLVVTSVIDAAEVRRVPDGPFEGFGEPALDEYWTAEAIEAVRMLAPSDAIVIWADAASIRLPDAGVTRAWNERLAAYNELVAMLDERFAHVGIVSLAARLGAPGDEMDLALRPDGVHLTPAAATAVAEDWLADEVIDAWRAAARSAAVTGCLAGEARRPRVMLARCDRTLR